MGLFSAVLFFAVLAGFLLVLTPRAEAQTANNIEQNFASIARNIGKHAVIAKGLNPVEWYGEVAEKYLGKDHNDYFSLLPPC